MSKERKEQILKDLEEKGLRRSDDTTSTEKLNDDVKKTLKKMQALNLQQNVIIARKKAEILQLNQVYLKVI
mgnify:CR=1 FL=1